MSIAEITLAINVGSDPIEGSFTASKDGPRPFYGWVELTAAIEAVRGVPAPAPHPRVAPGKD
jgi:hypothetical protein